MRLVVVLILCACSASCVKTDLAPLPHVTRVEISHSRYGQRTKDLSEPGNVSAVVQFIDLHRLGWTRPYVFGFGAPAPFIGVDLCDGDNYVGEFTVRSGVLPGGNALFEVRYGKIRAHKRVPKSEANRFLDLIGMEGQLK